MNWVNQILQRWQDLVIPVAVLVFFLLLLLWLRNVAYRGLHRWAKRTKWQGDNVLIRAVRTPVTLLIWLIAVFLAIEVSMISAGWKSLAAQVFWSLFILIVAMAVIKAVRGLIQLYLKRFEVSPRAISLSSNIARAAVLVVAALMVMGIWGVPISPLVLFIGVVAVAAVLAFRHALANLFAGFQLITSGNIKLGDYIKLESGEEGYVTKLNWTNMQLEALDASKIIIPNAKLAESKVINYGRPLKQAKEPFRFYTRLHLKELTGLKARTLRELVDTLKKAPDSVVYYHTHHFVEEHHYLTPEPANDFALWVTGALGDEALGERLASLDTFEFPTLGALKERIIDIIEEYLARNPDAREALPGREFHFVRSTSVIMPLPYVAHDLREFVEVLRNVSLGSLYFHIFESRLRLAKGLNDFSIWMEDSAGEPELAKSIAQLDPYNYTLEALRSSLIQLVEKHIK